MRAEIISVGTELLLGDIVNTNAQFLARELASLGLSVYYQTVVGDNPERLSETVELAKSRSDILVFTGGLGPTEDDLTKQTVAASFGDTLVMDAEELAKIECFFVRRGYPMSANNAKQAMLPQNGAKLLNPHGTAPGVMLTQNGKIAFLLPGPPREMKPMFLEQVRPRLLALQDAALHSLTLRVFGMGESTLEEEARALLEGSNPTAALYAKTGEVHVRITARAQRDAQAAVMCEECAQKFRHLLGDLIYSETEDDLAGATVHALARTNWQLATAESCTGGLLSQRITGVPGASAVFGFGLCSYSNTIKQQLLGVAQCTLDTFGAVSQEVSIEMAVGAAKQARAHIGVGITGIAGPDGGTVEKPVGLVYVTVCKGTHTWTKELQLGGRGREMVRWLATQHALDMVRRLALGLAIPDAVQDFLTKQ